VTDLLTSVLGASLQLTEPRRACRLPKPAARGQGVEGGAAQDVRDARHGRHRRGQCRVSWCCELEFAAIVFEQAGNAGREVMCHRHCSGSCIVAHVAGCGGMPCVGLAGGVLQDTTREIVHETRSITRCQVHDSLDAAHQATR
jgi:hypothetical protein